MKRTAFLLLLGAGLLVAAGSYLARRYRNPYPQVEWVQDWPGAGTRYVTFTPVLKTNPQLALGPTVGADYGELRFEDVDQDGTPEVVIETNDAWLDDAFSHGRQVLRHQVDATGRDQFVLVSSQEAKLSHP